MASVLIRDGRTVELVAELAKRRGTTKTEAVRRAVEADLARDGLPHAQRRSSREILEQFWRDHPLGEPTGLEADKAFYDSLSDQEDD